MCKHVMQTTENLETLKFCQILLLLNVKAWFKRRILHAPNQILVLVDSNEYVRLI